LRLSLRALTRHWKLKLASLALAVLLWVVVSAEQVTTQWIPVAVQPELRDPGYVLSGGPDPARVRVRFSGPGRELWEVALQRPVLVLPLQNVGSARSFILDPAMVRVPEGSHVQVQDILPAVVHVDLQRVATRTVPVRPQIGSRSLERYVLGDSVRVTPDRVTVTGPENVLAALDTVATRPFDIVPGDSTFSRRIGIDTSQLGGVTVSVPEVRVSGRVDRRVDRAFAIVPVVPPAGLAVTPAQVELHVTGGERVVRAIFPATLRATVRRDLLPAVIPPGGVTAPVVVDGLPRGTQARTVPAQVRVSAPGMPGGPVTTGPHTLVLPVAPPSPARP
jgi:hypothetical protein